MGGAKLMSSFRADGLITGYWLGLIPVVLGAGIPLFESPGPRQNLRLTAAKAHPSGVVHLTYQSARD